MANGLTPKPRFKKFDRAISRSLGDVGMIVHISPVRDPQTREVVSYLYHTDNDGFIIAEKELVHAGSDLVGERKADD